MRPMAKDIYIISAKRTVFGAFGGSLKGLSATDLGVIASESALKEAGVAREDFGHVMFGNVMQTSVDAIYLGRHVGLRAELPENVPALTINRLCGSGFQAVISGAEQILLGDTDVTLVGGTESMSQAPHIIRGARFGLGLGKGDLEDSLWTCLTDSYTGLPMAMTAEKLAEQYEITQDAVDDYCVASQQKFAKAQQTGVFDAELVPVTVKSRRKELMVDKDEHNRPETNLEGLKKLPKVFKKDGVIHAAAASGICDGAAALVLASGDYVEKHGLKPLAKLVGFGVSGCDPTIMGIGPVPATKQLLARTDSTIGDYDLIEVNEAFAPQVLAVKKALEIPGEKLNVNGGALAVGHPLGASGARITAHLVHEIRRRGGRYALGSACIGGGQGIALAIEAVQ
ncbi:MAG: acetyl-CoA C-acetyltransferase [Myxococcota bacterium]|nr:acetyl-CoA C-acetyltransferase [Myxococcota bacterium]